MKYEDLNTFDGTSFFGVCNENYVTWNEVLDGVEVDNAAAICSGGEIAFLSILPRVRESLTLIDHCYGSMYYAIGKYKLIENLGPEKALEVLKTAKHTDLEAMFAEGNAGLSTTNKTRQLYCNEIRYYWDKVELEAVEAFYANREKITFVHGDLSDLAERGPFDLLYLSNALDYSGRNGRKFNLDKAIKSDGYIAHCGYHGYLPTNCNHIKNTYGSHNGPTGASWGCKLAKMGATPQEVKLDGLSW